MQVLCIRGFMAKTPIPAQTTCMPSYDCLVTKSNWNRHAHHPDREHLRLPLTCSWLFWPQLHAKSAGVQGMGSIMLTSWLAKKLGCIVIDQTAYLHTADPCMTQAIKP